MLSDYFGWAVAIDRIGWSIILAMFVLIAYFLVCHRRKLTPDLTHALTIATACFGVVAAIALMWLTYKSLASDLGVLYDQKHAILIGGFAMMWVSISAAYKTLVKPATP